MRNLRTRQIHEIHRLIKSGFYATEAEAERALVDIGLDAVFEKNGMKPLPVGREART